MRALNKAQTDELDALLKEHRRLTPDHVWQAARKRSSSLHDRFEWDVEKAAIRTWQETARNILQVWTVKQPDAPPRRVVISVGSKNPGYVPPAKIEPAVLVAMFLDDIDSVIKRHAHLKLIAPDVYRRMVIFHEHLAAQWSKEKRGKVAKAG